MTPEQAEKVEDVRDYVASPTASGCVSFDDARVLLAALDDARAKLRHATSWYGLLETLNEHYPCDIFPRGPDDPKRDPLPRIVSLIAALDEARRERDEKTKEAENVRRGSETYRADRDYHLNRAIEATKEAAELRGTVALLRDDLSAARAAAIEECAKVCDASEVRWREQAHDVRADLAEFLATRIRVLLERPQ